MKLARTTAVVFILALGGLVFVATHDAAGQQGLPSPVPVPPGVPRVDGVYPQFTSRDLQFFNQAGHWGKWGGEEMKLEQEAQSLVGQYARTEDDSKRSELKKQLSKVLNKQFDAQQKRRNEEVAALEKQLKKVRELMQKRADAKDTIVEKRLDQLLREAEGLGWTAPSGPQIGNGFIPPSGSLYRRSNNAAK